MDPSVLLESYSEIAIVGPIEAMWVVVPRRMCVGDSNDLHPVVVEEVHLLLTQPLDLHRRRHVLHAVSVLPTTRSRSMTKPDDLLLLLLAWEVVGAVAEGWRGDLVHYSPDDYHLTTSKVLPDSTIDADVGVVVEEEHDVDEDDAGESEDARSAAATEARSLAPPQSVERR